MLKDGTGDDMDKILREKTFWLENMQIGSDAGEHWIEWFSKENYKKVLIRLIYRIRRLYDIISIFTVSYLGLQFAIKLSLQPKQIII